MGVKNRSFTLALLAVGVFASTAAIGKNSNSNAGGNAGPNPGNGNTTVVIDNSQGSQGSSFNASAGNGNGIGKSTPFDCTKNAVLCTGNNGNGVGNMGPGNQGLGVTGKGNTGSVSPVPEPHTYAMMLAGMGIIGFLAARKKKDLG